MVDFQICQLGADGRSQVIPASNGGHDIAYRAVMPVVFALNVDVIAKIRAFGRNAEAVRRAIVGDLIHNKLTFFDQPAILPANDDPDLRSPARQLG